MELEIAGQRILEKMNDLYKTTDSKAFCELIVDDLNS